MRKCSALAICAALSLGSAGSAQAAVMYDQNVTGNIIFGSGNDNGAFTINRDNGVELGLRAKLRFNDSNQPENTFNSNGNGTYTFQAGTPPTGFGFDPNSPTTPVWSFEWSINSDWDGSTANNLGTGNSDGPHVTFGISIDFDPSSNTDFRTFDPIHGPDPRIGINYFDNSLGTNSTANGAGIEAAGLDTAGYASLLAQNNLAQNSWNMEFWNEGAWDIFNPNVPGIYTIQLAAYNGDSPNGFAQVSIDVIVTAVPEPATLGLMLLGLSGLSLMAWRRRSYSPA